MIGDGGKVERPVELDRATGSVGIGLADRQAFRLALGEAIRFARTVEAVEEVSVDRIQRVHVHVAEIRILARRFGAVAGHIGCERRAGGWRVGLLRVRCLAPATGSQRSEEHTSELQSLMRTSYAVFCLKKKKQRQPRF